MAHDSVEKPSAVSLGTGVAPNDTKDNLQQSGLLGSEVGLFGEIGLGLGATPRAKELVLKGIAHEYQEQMNALNGTLKRKKGGQKKAISIAERRAAAVLGAADLWRDITGRDCPTQKAAIELAQQIDEILCDADPARKSLFPNTVTFKRFQDSVSDGLQKFGTDADRFLKE